MGEPGLEPELGANGGTRGVDPPRVDRCRATADLAHEEFLIGRGREKILARSMPEVRVPHEPVTLERLEVPIHGRKIRAWEASVETPGDLLRGHGAGGREQRLQHKAARR